MFPMTVTIHTAKQLNAVLAAMQPDLEAADFADPAVGRAYVEASDRVAKNETRGTSAERAAQPAAAKGNKPEASTTGKPSGATTAASSRTAEAGKGDAQQTKAGPSAPTYDDVKKAILDISKSKGRDAALKLLSEFGAEKGPDLKPEQFGEFLTKAKALLS